MGTSKNMVGVFYDTIRRVIFAAVFSYGREINVVKKIYSEEPQEPGKYLEEFDKFYTRSAGVYNLLVKVLPFWKNWLKQAIPHIRGRRVLEVSFGTGWLLTQYADKFEVEGIDYNQRMVEVARRNLASKNLTAGLKQGNVENLPYEDEAFDTIVNTMAFSGYPDGIRALSEMKRVLGHDGILILIDINYPSNDNWAGRIMTRLWQAGGDIIRDMDSLLNSQGLLFEDSEIGGFGSVHMYLCQKKQLSRPAES